MLSLNKPTALKLTILVTAILLSMAYPESLFLISKGIKKQSGDIELRIPEDKLSKYLSVNSCSEESLSSLYDSASNFNQARTGLRDFKTRLSKEYKNSSKSFAPLAVKVLARSESVIGQSSSCIMPLKIIANPELAVDISNQELLEVSLGSQSIFCSKKKAYLNYETRFFSVDEILTDYVTRIRQKKAVSVLKKQFAKLKKDKAVFAANNKNVKVKLDKQIRKTSIAISYAQYFAKDAYMLSSFFDAVCQQVAFIATPNSEPSTETIVPTTIATSTSALPDSTSNATTRTPGVNVTHRPTATITASNTATRTATPVVPTYTPTRIIAATTATVVIPTLTPTTISKTATNTPVKYIPTATENLCKTKSSKVISQYGITWTFDKPYPCGQFANGDYWVLGPVTIDMIDPKDNINDGIDKHGSMLGPNSIVARPSHGFDSRIKDLTYDTNLNIAKKLPFAIPKDNSLISSISREDPSDTRLVLEHQAILTVLSKIPDQEGSFRPSYLGSNKTLKWNLNNIDYSKLKSVVRSNSFDLNAMEKKYSRSLVILGGQDQIQFNYLLAASNLPEYGKNYGRELSLGAAQVSLALNSNLSNAQKEKMAIGIIQAGLDIYSGVALGNYFKSNGGHTNGYKLPMLMAGVLLSDNNIISQVNGELNKFSEDGSHYYVSQVDLGTARRDDKQPNRRAAIGAIGCAAYIVNKCDRPLYPYTSIMLGMPEWGAGGAGSYQTGSNWSVTYRDITGPNLIGSALVAHIMKVENLWNDPAFFDYINQRAWPTFSTSSKVDSFIKSTWVDHRSAVGMIPAGYVSSSPTKWKP